MEELKPLRKAEHKLEHFQTTLSNGDRGRSWLSADGGKVQFLQRIILKLLER